MNFPVLSLLIWFPILGGSFLLALTREKYIPLVRNIALAVTIITLALSFALIKGFESHSFEMQWTEQIPWIPSLGIEYALGIDGFSLPLIVLNCFMTLIVVIASSKSVKTRVAKYLAAFLIMEGLITGALAALDAILFYIFWEGMLIPMFLIIGIWGSTNRMYATIKFFLFTFLGSVLLLISLLYLHIKAQSMGIPLNETFSILIFQLLPLDLETQKWLFIAFFLAFAVKVPMWPIHTWLPDAHVEAPTGGSVVLAAVLLKMGGYGFLRFLLPILPDASKGFALGVSVLSLIAIAYIGFVAIVQKDMKKLIAYSSISHMGFVTLGCFLVFAILSHTSDTTGAVLGIEGAMVQMISHGFVSAALFLCVGVLYDRMHTRLIKDFGGVVNTMPIFASFFMLFAMANVGLPGTSGFVGEFLVILSAFKAQFWIAAVAASILVLGAGYTLWMYKRVVFGTVQHQDVGMLSDLTRSEISFFTLLAISILALGVWPAPLLDLMEASSTHLIEHVLRSKM